jgi:hypothetical protein
MLLAAGIGMSVNYAMAQNLSTDTERTTTQSSQSEENVAARPDQDGSNQSNESGTQADQVPQQSMPSVGHPAEGGQTGQFGVKKFNESESKAGDTQPAR